MCSAQSAFIGALLAAYLSTSCICQGQGQLMATTPIPQSVVQPLGALSNMVVYLNDYQSQRDTSNQTFAFYAKNASYVSTQPPGASSPSQSYFDVPPIRSDPYTIYLDGWRSSEVLITTAPPSAKMGGALVLTVSFPPVQIRTDCVNNIICVADPNFELDGLQVTLSLHPSVTADGHLTYDGVTAASTLKKKPAPGMCENNFFAFLCGLAPNDNKLESTLNNKIVGPLMNDVVRTSLSHKLDCLVRQATGVRQQFCSAEVGSSGELRFGYCSEAAVATNECG